MTARTSSLWPASILALCVGLAPLGCEAVSAHRAIIAPNAGRATLEAGNRRFLDGGAVAHAWQSERVVQTGEFGQRPQVGVLTCADSRTPPELIFDEGVGDLFVVRVAGNFVDPGALGPFESGASALGMHTIVVMGHTKCGAVTATCAGEPLPGHMDAFTSAIKPAVVGITDVRAAEVANVRYQIKQLREKSEILAKAEAAGELQFLVAMYAVDTGRVWFLDSGAGGHRRGPTRDPIDVAAHRARSAASKSGSLVRAKPNTNLGSTSSYP